MDVAVGNGVANYAARLHLPRGCTSKASGGFAPDEPRAGGRRLGPRLPTGPCSTCAEPGQTKAPAKPPAGDHTRPGASTERLQVWLPNIHSLPQVAYRDQWVTGYYRHFVACIFCSIVSGEVPCWRVFEDDDCLASWMRLPPPLGTR